MLLRSLFFLRPPNFIAGGTRSGLSSMFVLFSWLFAITLVVLSWQGHDGTAQAQPYSYITVNTILPNASLPRVSITPTINMCSTFGMTTSSNAPLYNQAVQLWLSWANAQGGVTIHGQQYYFSWTWVDDSSNAGLIQILYQQFAKAVNTTLPLPTSRLRTP